MKSRRALYTVIVSLIFIYGCAVSKYTVSTKGDIAEIEFTNNLTAKGELLWINDSSIVFIPVSKNEEKKYSKIYYALIKNINKMEIQGYSNNSWILPVVLFQFVPAFFLSIAAEKAGTEGGGVLAAAAIPGILSALIFSQTDIDPPSWNKDMNITELFKLKKYARYLKTLNNEELSILLTMHNLNGIKKFN